MYDIGQGVLRWSEACQIVSDREGLMDQSGCVEVSTKVSLESHGHSRTVKYKTDL